MEKDNLNETVIENTIDVNDTQDTQSLKKNVIEISNLSKTFGKRKAISNLNLVVESGQVYGLIGTDASGKTTLIKTMLNLLKPDKGSIRLNGFDLKTNFYKAMEKTGCVVEDTKFYSYLSGYENLLMLAKLYKKLPKTRIDEVLKTVNLTDRAKDKVKTYSKGMMQRLAIAASLLNDPELIILDEPTNSLDSKEIIELNKLIINLSKENKTTFFIATNRLNDIVTCCTNIGILVNGEFVHTSSVQELLDNNVDILDIKKNQDYIEKLFLENIDKGGEKID